jgi:hypothetical protein
MQVAKLLNLVPYCKREAMKELEAEFGWRYYGTKHYESRWTQFFQGWWLPERFGYDKRFAHLSSLILSGEITRVEALGELNRPRYSSEMLAEDIELVSRKLRVRHQELEKWFKIPLKSHFEYRTAQRLTGFLKALRANVQRWVSNVNH